MTALTELARRIKLAREAGLLPREWGELAETAVREVEGQWQSERAFRLRTGASDKWCRQHFERCLEEGLARRDARGRREWHVHARLSRAGSSVEEIKRDIVQSFEAA